ncbi:hypothetical protein L5515_008195 [Caenorhabditis briggsae]|uniref:Uncharacterized protein n=1 Tax=Caenorhabditis briggsae TaxID=6238 RepID=A0AAE9JM07_CAEBR|nr:hypothetical protein L5515_008195 [Caenorhabditis briggsae]
MKGRHNSDPTQPTSIEIVEACFKDTHRRSFKRNETPLDLQGDARLSVKRELRQWKNERAVNDKKVKKTILMRSQFVVARSKNGSFLLLCWGGAETPRYLVAASYTSIDCKSQPSAEEAEEDAFNTHTLYAHSRHSLATLRLVTSTHESSVERD